MLIAPKTQNDAPITHVQSAMMIAQCFSLTPSSSN
jgi:hypothetical protein